VAFPVYGVIRTGTDGWAPEGPLDSNRTERHPVAAR
jgi:hypothetical protein